LRKTNLRYSFLLILLHCSLMAFSQNSKPTSFKDFPIVQNLDSFDLALRKNKTNPEQYLYDLITLEKNREDYTGWFGQDLDTIKTLAYKFNSPLAIASYHYFLGLKLRRQSINSACRNILEAIEYFEGTKDTLGMVKSYYAMILIGTLPKVYKQGKVQNRSFYFDRIMDLSQNSSDWQVKFVRIYAISFFEGMAKGKQNYSERIGEIEETLRILEANPSIQPPYAQLYSGIGSFYQRHNFLKLSTKCELKSHELFKKLTSKICIKSYLNMATVYYNDSVYTKPEPLLLKGISAMEQLKEEERDNTTLLNLYIILSEIQFYKKDYKAAQDSWKKTIEVQHKKNNAVQFSLFQELQTQNEINQREMDNALLLQKNQATEASKRQYMIALFIALASLVLFGILSYFLYKANAKKKQLIHFRDQLFAIIAHDMRTPLTAFKGFSEGVDFLLKKGEYQNIHILSQSIDQLIFNTNLLFDNLLSWYALQSINTKTNKSTFAVYELAKESADLYEPVAKKRKSTIEIAIPESLMLYANRNALLLIMRNLIDNAIKHGKSKKIVIKASMEANQVVIEVMNNDMTINNNRLVILQEQMKQGAVVIEEGRGLGLYLVSYFVEQHNGHVSIESSVQVGTKFKVTIPV
jgi:signal transduction histidine kinase